MQWRFAQTFFHRVVQSGCQLKMANLNFTIVTMKDILSTVRHVSLTVQGHVPIYIYIYHLLQNSKRQGCEKPEQGAQMSWKCGQYHENSS